MRQGNPSLGFAVLNQPTENLGRRVDNGAALSTDDVKVRPSGKRCAVFHATVRRPWRASDNPRQARSPFPLLGEGWGAPG